MMYNTTSLILILALLINGIRCPGVGGGTGEENRRREEESRTRERESVTRGSGGHVRSGSSEMPTWAAVIIIGIIIVALPCIYCAVRRSKRAAIFIRADDIQPLTPTASPKVPSGQNPFQTGTWSFQYHQYDRWHGPYRVLLSFDHQLHCISGKGADDVGRFTCDGLYSPENRQLNITLRYDEDTGNPEENLGHTSSVVLYWNSITNVFAGIWSARTHTYTGEGRFEMEFKEHIKPSSKPYYIGPAMQI